MALSVSTVLFFILSCGLWVAEARLYTSVLTVPNGPRWGRWGPAHFCSKGHAVGFQIKLEPFVMEFDTTSMNAIALLCDDGETVTSTIGPWGYWLRAMYCYRGKLDSFALIVHEATEVDYTATEGIVFHCSDSDELTSTGSERGRLGPMSNQCAEGYICGIQTRVQSPQYIKEDTALNDVKMFCCD
ncbi:vitelline membrane outer layer protein 1-like [Tiliqua scincoides]|uniref:vitelline membrane outer layer protein 1-like n=1 Tax=Tiliqua scincoides TaxID=71010 RepID=UPI0034632D75